MIAALVIVPILILTAIGLKYKELKQKAVFDLIGAAYEHMRLKRENDIKFRKPQFQRFLPKKERKD